MTMRRTGGGAGGEGAVGKVKQGPNLKWVGEKNWKTVPYCPFVVHFIGPYPFVTWGASSEIVENV